MKLEKILDNINSLEKNSFLKIIDNIKSSNPRNSKQIDLILSESSNNLKSVDSINIAKVFDLIKYEFVETVRAEFVHTTSQLDILIDILLKDGNNILKSDWFARLYENEIKTISKKTEELNLQLTSDKSNLDNKRKRDYRIYKACVNKAYFNDKENNRESKITDDELSILITLTEQLELSQEETKLINYSVIPPKKDNIDTIINYLKNTGIIFFSKKNNTIYVADEVVRVLRQIRGKELADKYYRRVLKSFREPQINTICRNHCIDNKNLDLDQKIRTIIKEGIPFRNIFINEIHKDSTTLTDKKKFINELWCNKLKISSTLRGITLEDKIDNLIAYFNELEKEEKVGISIDGYEKLLIDLNLEIQSLKKLICNEFELPDTTILNNTTLLDYNIKPRDILDIIPIDKLKQFVETKNIKSKGNLALNILNKYRDTGNLLIENYVALGYRDLAELKENGIQIKEAEVGLKFEDVTKKIFKQLGFNVDEKLKKELNTAKNKIDIVLNLGSNNIIIIECKTVKESGYNKFSSVSKQIKSYVDLAKHNEMNVVKSLLIAPEFSDEFVNDCGLEFEINLSLITAPSLISILEGFKESKHKQFPYQLLLKDVMIKEDRILKAIKK